MHGGVLHDDFVHLAWRDLLTTAIDDLLQASDDGDVPVFVHHALVAGAEPAVVKGIGVRLRVVLVLAHHVRSANHDLAGRASGYGRPGLVDDANLRSA